MLEANYPLSNGTDFQRKMEYKPFSRKVLKPLALLPVTWSFRLQNTWLRTKRFGANLTWWPNDRIPNFNGYSVHLSVEYTTKGKFCQAINICNLLFINFCIIFPIKLILQRTFYSIALFAASRDKVFHLINPKLRREKNICLNVSNMITITKIFCLETYSLQR